MKTITQLFFLFAFTAVGFCQTRTSAFIDFGNPDNQTEGYNNATETDPQDPASVLQIMDAEGNETGITLNMVVPFTENNTDGTTEAEENIAFPASATADSFYGSVERFFGTTTPSATFTLTGLDPELYYSFSIFASRVGDEVNDNRSTLYTVSTEGGSETATATLDAANNISERVLIEGIQPGEDGVITFRSEPAPENTNTTGFYYLGAIEMVISDDANLSTEDVAISNSLSVYPNPVSTQAQINLDLKEKTQLTIGVYDLSGRLVENIVDGEQAAGNFSTTWNRSSNLSAGLYILKIEANGKSVNSKLLLK